MAEAATEDYQLDLIGQLYRLTLGKLKEFVEKFSIVCTDVNTRAKVVDAVLRYVADEQEKDDGGLASFHLMNNYLQRQVRNVDLRNAVQGDQSSIPEIKPDLFVWKRDFKIVGQIGNSKTALRYSSLLKQIEEGIQKGYSEREVISAVIRSIVPGLSVRSYLEEKSRDVNFSLDELKIAIRTHFLEPTTTELYQSLGNAVQNGRESPQEFLMRLLDLRQKIIFISREEETGIQYDPELVNSMFRHALYTGLTSDTIRFDLKHLVENASTKDEELLQAMMHSISRENERQQKLKAGNRARLNRIDAPVVRDEPSDEKPKQESSEVQKRAEIAELKMLVNNGDTGKAQSRGGCHRCRRTGERCRHCWRCGAGDHFKVDCPKLQGQGGSHHGDRM